MRHLLNAWHAWSEAAYRHPFIHIVTALVLTYGLACVSAKAAITGLSVFTLAYVWGGLNSVSIY